MTYNGKIDAWGYLWNNRGYHTFVKENRWLSWNEHRLKQSAMGPVTISLLSLK